MKALKIGQKVSFIDDVITGKVVELRENKVILETEDGFIIEAEPNELIIEDGLEELDFDEDFIEEIKMEEEMTLKPRKSDKKRQKTQPPMEVDLHAHQLTDNERNMTKYDILNLQLDSARGQLEFAMKKGIQKVVFIHGVGEGILRMELETLLSRYDNLKFYDADYQKYGLGATEVYIYQQ